MGTEGKPSKYALTLPDQLRNSIVEIASKKRIRTSRLIGMYIRTALALHTQLENELDDSGLSIEYSFPQTLLGAVRYYKSTQRTIKLVREFKVEYSFKIIIQFLFPEVQFQTQASN
ncbi:MAG: hypothetical protein US53_C0016G0013 [Candidatus Woesebacteria bacterium GW2011_GWA1_37_7]|uniref:Uncharacterized protein n=1 Tax=Candidatus Woesebacteria bacterium GW2011_GWA1_37_7 TaxID=1618545 RepID=A0A0G0HG69_9BACT|nr:MAG: hypothetical protein US53_C0016G0013 [Candidatus Woesebacteria bacterium GW2011_GWA1_37_7]